MKRFESVDAYVDSAETWQDEMIRLREILQSSGLEETVKWGGPCYTYDGRMVVGFGAFKSYVALWFYQGALLSDRDDVLINAQEGRTKALRQWRFTASEQIKPEQIQAYVLESIELQMQGKRIKPDRNKPLVIPPQLNQALDDDERAGAAFNELSRGRKREYAEYISEAKREETKAKRLAKILPMITAGVGLNDRYRK